MQYKPQKTFAPCTIPAVIHRGFMIEVRKYAVGKPYHCEVWASPRWNGTTNQCWVGTTRPYLTAEAAITAAKAKVDALIAKRATT